MESKTETSTWFVLRYYHPDTPNEVVYAKGHVNGPNYKQYWSLTEELVKAHHFPDRKAARRSTQSVRLQDKFRGNVDEFFWEVVKITETRVISYEQEVIVSNAPPLVQLARCAE